MSSTQKFSSSDLGLSLADQIGRIRFFISQGRFSSALPLVTFLMGRVAGSQELIVDAALAAARCFLELDVPDIAGVCLDLASTGQNAEREGIERRILQAELLLEKGDFGECEIELQSLRGRLDRMEGQAGVVWRARADILRARSARASGRPDRAVTILDGVLSREMDDPCVLAHAHLERTLALRDAGRMVEAAGCFEKLIQGGALCDNRYMLAKASWIYGQFLGVYADQVQGDSARPADLLARALDLFRSHGLLRDVEQVRHAFRAFGRRDTDRLEGHPLFERDRDVRTAYQELADEVLLLVDAVVRTAAQGQVLPEPVALALAQHVARMSRILLSMEMTYEGVVAAAKAAVMQQRRLARLIDGLGSLGREMDRTGAISGIVDLAIDVVDARAAVLALVSRQGSLEVYSKRGIEDDSWKPLTQEALGKAGTAIAGAAAGTGDALRRPVGPAVALALRAGSKTHGVLYVSKGNGVLSNRDVDLLEVLAVQVGMLIDRNKAHWSLHVAAETREATLEAISDGVITVGTDGAIVQVSSSAARMFGRTREQIVGLPIASVMPLKLTHWTATCLEQWDGRVVALSGGEVVLSARVVRADAGDVAGTVVTLTELKRAKKAAQRLTGASARYRLRHVLSRSPLMAEQVELARSAAETDSNVLIIGESGTGKEVFAQAIHNASRRSVGPFVGINCAAIPTELLESELFGYEEGAFTGARRGGRPGKFELAEGGTLLLDEIGDMPLEMQAKLLRVLQERHFRRVGGHRELPLDARVIATTNQDLEELVFERRFREDLLYRLRVIELRLPPLRQRREDVDLLAQHFLEMFARRMGKNLRRIAPDVVEFMRQYEWPGNVRQLEHVIESEVSLAPAEKEVLDNVPAALRPRATLLGIPVRRRKRHQSMSLVDAERELLVAAMTEHRGSIQDVAQALGISRGTVYNKLRKYGIDPSRFRKD